MKRPSEIERADTELPPNRGGDGPTKEEGVYAFWGSLFGAMYVLCASVLKARAFGCLHIAINATFIGAFEEGERERTKQGQQQPS